MSYNSDKKTNDMYQNNSQITPQENKANEGGIGGLVSGMYNTTKYLVVSKPKELAAAALLLLASSCAEYQINIQGIPVNNPNKSSTNKEDPEAGLWICIGACAAFTGWAAYDLWQMSQDDKDKATHTKSGGGAFPEN